MLQGFVCGNLQKIGAGNGVAGAMGARALLVPGSQEDPLDLGRGLMLLERGQLLCRWG